MEQLQSPSSIPLVEPITEREREILGLIAGHRTNKEIAASLDLALSTVKWYTQQIFHKLAVENRRQAVERATALGILGGDKGPSQLPNNLPAPATAFVGREIELSDILSLLSTDGSRLITLHGPGGSGKTRLAIQAATRLVESGNSFSNGVWFVSLAPLQNPESIVQAIASATGYTYFDREREPLQQLVDYLRQRHMLLVMDNFEHLISTESIRHLTEITARAPHVKMLVTSRTRLNIHGEHLFSVAGMQMPGTEQLYVEDWTTFNALRFFLICARRIQPKFEISADNSASVIRICQRLEAMPLGIEMATAWLELLTPLEIESEIDRSFDFLQAQGVEERHQSLRAVFDTSWKLLSTAEQGSLTALTIFQGSFTREAAQRVSMASLQTLLLLVNKSWLTGEVDGRYHIHELLRQYAYEKLRTDPAMWDNAKNRHAQYYAALLRELGEQMRGPNQLNAFNITEREFENIRSAWEWLTEQGQFATLTDQMLLALTLYCEAKWRTRDTLPLILLTQEKLGDNLTHDSTVIYKAILTLAELAFYSEFFSLKQISDFDLLWGRSLPDDRVTFAWNVLSEKAPNNISGFWLILSAEFYAWRSQSERSIQRLHELKKIFVENQDLWFCGVANQSLARVTNWFEATKSQIASDEYKEKHDEVIAILQEALRQFRVVGDRWKEGHTLRMLATQESNLKKKLSLLQQAKDLLDIVGDITTSTLILHALAVLNQSQGNYAECFASFHEQQKILDGLGNQGLLSNAYAWESIIALRFSDISHARRTRDACLAILRRELDSAYQQGSQNSDRLEALYAWALWELGEIERVAGDLEKASENYQEANRIFERLHVVAGIAFYHRGMGDLTYLHRDFAAAKEYFQTSVELSRSVPHSWLETYALCGLGRTAVELGQYEVALEYLTKALQMSQQLKNLQLFMIAFAGMASLHQANGEHEHALELCSYVLQHFASWNETKELAMKIAQDASAHIPAEVAEAAKLHGENAELVNLVNRYLEKE